MTGGYFFFKGLGFGYRGRFFADKRIRTPSPGKCLCKPISVHTLPFLVLDKCTNGYSCPAFMHKCRNHKNVYTQNLDTYTRLLKTGDGSFTTGRRGTGYFLRYICTQAFQKNAIKRKFLQTKCIPEYNDTGTKIKTSSCSYSTVSTEKVVAIATTEGRKSSRATTSSTESSSSNTTINTNRESNSTTSSNINTSNKSDSISNSSTENSRWTFKRIFVFVIFASAVCAIVYEFYEAGATEWRLRKKLRRYVLGGDKPNEAEINSRYRCSFSSEIQHELAKYFLQLDIDKPNGVRRTDALQLVEELGFDSKSEPCAKFIAAGKGRLVEDRRTAGCTLQELGELIEELLFLEQQEMKEQEPNKDLNQQQQQEIEIESSERVLNALLNLNKTSVATAWEIPKPSVEDVAADCFDEEEEIYLLELREKTISKKLQVIENIKKRRQLSQAETVRIKDLTEELKNIKGEIYDKKLLKKDAPKS